MILKFINNFLCMRNNRWFTLVELIVTITILAILATIWFVSFQGYWVSARDSVRLSDISNIDKALNYFEAENQYFPEPTNWYNVTYSGWVVWTQWVFWDSMLQTIQNMSQVPVDPLTWLPYTYSILNNKKEYQVAWILEWSQVAQINPISQAYVNGKNLATAVVKWNYNGKLAKVTNWSTTYILAVPTIISWDITLSDIEQLINQQKLVYKNHANLPANYENTQFDTNWGFNYTPNQIILFEWDIEDINNDETQRLNFLINLQDAYSGTVVENESNIQPILATPVNIDNVSEEVRYLAAEITSEVLQKEITLWATDPNVNFNGTPKSWNYLPDDLTQLYREWSIYLHNWENNTCDYKNMNVVQLNPGTDTIPQNLTENTIYSLSAGNYIVSSKRIMNDCTALIAQKNQPAKLFANSAITSEWLLDARPKDWIILHGLEINGESDWWTWNHNKNIAWLNFRFSKNLSINNVDFNNSWVWVYIYDSTSINIINSTVNNHTNSWLYSYWSGKMLFKNIITHNNWSNWLFTNASGPSKWENIFENITAYNNSENWIRIYWNEGRKLTNITTYNNTSDGINIFYGLNTYLENIESYNNTARGINIQHETWLSLQNIKTYNNNSTWLYTYAVGNIIANNIETYDNSDSGFYNLSEKWTNTYTNVLSYNNTAYWFYIRQYGSVNDTINKITAHNNWSDGILLYGTTGLVWSELISYSNTGNGLWITYNEWGITIINSNFYNNNWSWIDTWATWNMNIRQVNTYNNNKSGILNSATKLSNIFSNIRTFNNNENWFYIRSSWSKNDEISYVNTYNNWQNWIHLYQINEININNVLSYNNSSNWYVTWYSSRDSINNSQFFNNGQSWIYYNIWNDHVINNTLSYNNGSHGLYLRNTQWNKLNNVLIYNNVGNALYSYAWMTWDGSWEYYGTMWVYGNWNNATTKLTPASDWFLWMTNWVLDNTWIFDNTQTTSILNNWWNYTLKWKQSLSITWNELYNYGNNILKQSQPIKHDGTNHELYWTDWNEYDSNLYITE